MAFLVINGRMERRMTVLTQEDTIKDALIKMSEGNPGALKVLYEYYKAEKKNLDESAIGLSLLDFFDIRGWKIWVAYESIYEKDIKKFIEGVRSQRIIADLFNNAEFIQENEAYRKT